jgi:hypothetical protein
MVHKYKSQDKFVVIYEEEDIVGHATDEETEETYPLKKTFVKEKIFNNWRDVEKFNEDMSVWHGEEGTRFKILTAFDKKTRESVFYGRIL